MDVVESVLSERYWQNIEILGDCCYPEITEELSEENDQILKALLGLNLKLRGERERR